MLIYETPIKFFQYFIATLSCFYVIPIYFFTIYGNSDHNMFIYLIGIASFIVALIQFLYMLKRIQIYDDCIVVKRPFFIKYFNRTFQKKEIEKIIFRLSSASIGGGINLIVFQKKIMTNFQVISNRQTLNDLILNLRSIDIPVETELKTKK